MTEAIPSKNPGGLPPGHVRKLVGVSASSEALKKIAASF
jgi:hypothetical protein